MADLTRPVRLRGHHLLCMLGFRGRGYSPGFVTALAKVVKEFRSDPALPVVVVTGCDDVCAFCPYAKDSLCQKGENSYEQKVRAKDAEVLSRLSLHPGAPTTSGEVLNRIKLNISDADLTGMCRKCEWVGFGYCHEGLAKLRNGEEIPFSA